MEVGPEAVDSSARATAGAGGSPPRAGASAPLRLSRLAGAEYPQWALAVTAVAAVSYSLSIANALLFGGPDIFPNLWSEIIVAGLTLLVLPTARRQPTRAAIITLVAVWLEMQYGFYTTRLPLSLGALATPLLVAGAGLLLGSRWALAFAVSSAVMTPTLVLLSPLARNNPAMVDGEFERFYVLHAIADLGVWVVITTALRAFGRSYLKTAASEQRLAETIRMAPDGILVVAEGERVTAINPAAERILGIAADACLGNSLDALLRDAGADDDARLFLRSRRTAMLPLAVVLRRPGRETTHMEVTSRTMHGGAEQWMLRDVTGRVRDEMARRDMELQLSHVQRMEAVGQLAGGIAHDFNNLLTAIGASAEMLRADAVREEDRALVDDILAAQERGRTLTRQLLSFARREMVQPRVFDLAAQVQQMERLLARVAGERVRFSFVLGEDCRVRADVGQVEQALVNLVSNAKDAMPDGGACRISVQRVPAGDEAGAWVSMSVSDTGVGMDEQVMRRAFEPFFTTKPRGKGTGLGLASVHGIVTANEGRVRLESVSGLGTTVIVELPAVDAPLETTSAPEPRAAVPGVHASLLVAEDDAAIRSTVRRILTRAGYTVVVAPDGLEAARIAEARGTPFDLVLTDVIMPSLTGPQLVARLRTLWPRLPALFMSGYPEDALADMPSFSIQRDFLAKPFTAAELLRRVAEALASGGAHASPGNAA